MPGGTGYDERTPPQKRGERATMWNRRKDEEPARPLSSMNPVSVPNEGVPLNAVPANYERTARATANLGENVFVTGQIFAKEDLIIDGQVDGMVELLEHKLTVGKNGKVKANVKAREVVIMGAVQGNVEASDKIDLRRDAHLVGDIRAARIAIEDGAVFKGSIDITRVTEATRPTVPRPATAPAQAAAAAAGSGSGTAAGSTPVQASGDAKR